MLHHLFVVITSPVVEYTHTRTIRSSPYPSLSFFVLFFVSDLYHKMGITHLIDLRLRPPSLSLPHNKSRRGDTSLHRRISTLALARVSASIFAPFSLSLTLSLTLTLTSALAIALSGSNTALIRFLITLSHNLSVIFPRDLSSRLFSLNPFPPHLISLRSISLRSISLIIKSFQCRTHGVLTRLARREYNASAAAVCAWSGCEVSAVWIITSAVIGITVLERFDDLVTR